MHRRRRRKVKQEGVTLNMAAMLDMAFQLLAFFIATFKPMTIEQPIAPKLPPPERIKSDAPSQRSIALPPSFSKAETAWCISPRSRAGRRWLERWPMS